ncbi:PIF1-like helicase [Hirsutella rhossiliensis]
MDVRSRNRRVSMLSVTRKNFPEVERIVQSLTADRLAAARVELESSGTTTDDGVKELLRCLSLYGYRQPMSRELRLSMRRKIQSLILCRGVPAIWFTLNPNDITNPVKLRLAAYRTRDPEAAEAFLRSLDMAFKRARLAISDPLSSAEFFHREMTLFFENYVRVGEESVFGRISHYYGAVETNERGALHVHGLLWLQGNAHLSSMLVDIHGEDQAAYRERIVRYVDSVFSEDLDQEGFCAIQAERSVTSDISQLLGDERQFSASFDEEANFCAGATQIHTHSPTCVKYSLGKGGRKSDLCRFKAPWGLVDETAFTGDGVLRIRRSHSMVNRWNKAIAVGLRHNHDISFIATQRKTMALVYYVTNYATKVEDPTWKRVAAAADLLPPRAGEEMADDAEVRGGEGGGDDGKQNRTRQFLMKVANRVFTERPLSQVEVIADLLGYPTELTNNGAWAFLNVSVLYWHVFRQWPHLRRESGASTADGSVDESILVEEAGQRICRVEAYRHRGDVLRGLCLYDYISLVRLKRNDTDKRPAAWEVLRRPGKQAMVCLDGYLSKDFDEDDEGSCYRRAAVQHLALFVPWESFLGEESGGIDRIWRRERAALVPRISCYVDNVQLLRRSAEDAKRDAKQWAASSGDRDATAVHPDEDGTGRRVSSLDRSSIGANQITAGSPELTAMMQELSRFQQLALSSSSEFQAAILSERGPRRINIPGGHSPEPEYRRRVSVPTAAVTDRRAAVRSVLTGFGDDDIQMTAADLEETVEEASAGMEIRLGTSTSFIEAGKALVARFTLNKKQGKGNVRQLCQFVGGEGGTGKSRVIEALVELFASKDQSNRLIITATSGTAAARINGITIHSACGFSKDLAAVANTGKDLDGVRMPNQAERTVVSWDMDNSFKAEQRHQHDKAHALWKRFTAVVMLDEQDRTDLDLLNTRCYQEGRQIPWASGITVVTPLNRNRWNLNMEASLAFQIQHRSTLRIFISGHKWKEGLPTEEEAIMILNQGDDSAIPVPAVFMFVPGMPVVVNHNTHQGLKLVNGASYAALEVILDKSYPGIASRPT